MKRTLSLVALVLVVCAFALPATAEVTRNDKYEVSAFVSNLCNEDIMMVEARLHILEITDTEGTVTQHFTVHGTAVGLLYPEIEYIFNQTTLFVNPQCPGWRESFVRAISKGSEVNELLHLTQECLPDGTMVTIDMSFVCPGDGGEK